MNDRIEPPLHRTAGAAPAGSSGDPNGADAERELSRAVVRADGAPDDDDVSRERLRDAVADVVRARAAAARGSSTWASALDRAVATLRARVAEHVSRRRESGGAVERLIPEVRAVVNEVAPAETWYDSSREGLVSQVVRWTIEAYYDEPAQTLVPRFY